MSQTFTDDCFASGHVAQTDMQNIENNFAAVKSNFSGPSAPANLVAGMPWFDTDDNQLWIRKVANTSWMSLGFAPGTVMLFGQNSAPLGWTRKINWQDNAMLCYAATGNIGSGGSQNPQTHTHTGPAHTHSVPRSGWGEVQTTYSGRLLVGTPEGTYSMPTGDNTSGSGGTAATGASTGYYQEVIACEKD